MVRALILGFVAWCVEAVLLVVLIAAAFAAAGPRTIDAGPPCPSGADWRQLGGDGSLLPKFFASHPLDSTARVEACLALASTDLAAAKVGIGRLGSAAAPPLFARLRAASGDDRTSLDRIAMLVPRRSSSSQWRLRCNPLAARCFETCRQP